MQILLTEGIGRRRGILVRSYWQYMAGTGAQILANHYVIYHTARGRVVRAARIDHRDECGSTVCANESPAHFLLIYPVHFRLVVLFLALVSVLQNLCMFCMSFWSDHPVLFA